MSHIRLIALSVLVCLSGCGILNPVTGLDSGIDGIITAGPQCTIQTVPPTPGCEDQPISATVIVRSTSGLFEVTRFTTAADGRFHVPLEPGTYQLDPQSGPNGFPHGSPQNVTVAAGAFTNVTIRYDTGIR